MSKMRYILQKLQKSPSAGKSAPRFPLFYSKLYCKLFNLPSSIRFIIIYKM